MNAIVPQLKPKSVAPAPIPDRAAIVQTFKMIVGDGNVTELRALDASVNGDRWRSTISGYFDNGQALADACMTITSAVGVYLVLNPILPDLLARSWNHIKRAKDADCTKDHDILRRRWLPIDVDAVRPSGISSTDREHEAAQHRAGDIWSFIHDELGWGDPIEASSGNGAHLLYAIDMPTDDGGKVQKFLKMLSAKFSDSAVKVDTSVHNPARIWRLYGTPACKGDSIPSRPHRLSRILRAPREMLGGAA